MFELMTDERPVVCVLGPTISPEMTVVGQITPYYDVLQVHVCNVNRGSYMSAHVLLNLLNELGKR